MFNKNSPTDLQMRYLLILTGIFMLLNNTICGQIVDRRLLPVELEKEKLDIPVIILEEIDIKKLEKEDREHLNSGLKSFRFAENILVDIDTENEGIWKDMPDGGRVWFVKIKSPGAYSLSALFNHYRIPPGAKLFIYSSDKSHVRGAFTYKNNKSNYVLPTAPVKGDEIVIEYYEPKSVEFNGELHIASIAHDYKGILNYFSKDTKAYGSSGACNVNINCDTDSLWQVAKHSVCKIIFNGLLCTGALINNTNNDGHPYFLTANHCISNDFDASNAIFYFNYESPGCINANGPEDQTVAGSIIIATPEQYTLDFTLLELSIEPPSEYKPYYAGWSRDVADPTSVTSIHHPSGDIKKITKSYDGAVTGDYGEGYTNYTHWWIDEWDEGTTEGGSSGSPLFNQNGEIIGDLTGGDASCSYNFNDYYLQFHQAWEYYSEPEKSLKSWLDPGNIGVVSQEGYLPYDEVPSHLKASLTDTVVNLVWNKVVDESIIDYYNVYRNSVLYDNSANTNYNDIDAYKDSVYIYYITAEISAGGETDTSNIVYIRSMDPLTTEYTEDYEGQFSIPTKWYEERSNDTVGWEFKTGGFASIMDTAYEGSINAYFYNNLGESSKLVMPRFDFSGNTNVVLSFYLHNRELSSNIHELKILYKNSDLNTWEEIRSYNSDSPGWTKKSISLPELTDNYQIAIEAIGNGGYGICIDSISIKEDGNYITPVFSVDKDSACKNEDVVFSTSLSAVNSFKWEFGEGAVPTTGIGIGPHTVSYSSGGIKTVNLIVNDTYLKKDINSVTIFDIPAADYRVIDNTLTSNSPFGNQWYLDGNPIDGATKQSYVIVEDGNYYVEVCSFQSLTKYLVVDGIEEVELDELISKQEGTEISVYPNPNSGVFTLKITSAKEFTVENVNYEILDITGRVLQRGKLNLSNEAYFINAGNLNNGLYFLKINYSDKQYTTKIVIKK